MADRKKTTKAPVRAAAPTRGSRGKTREGACFPVSPPRAGLPREYAETFKTTLPPVDSDMTAQVFMRETSVVRGCI